jgi:hypothetical protein
MPANSNIPMHTPDGKASPAVPVTPAPIPVEKLLDSEKPETPLVVEGGSSSKN